jgi:hypothetical protein
MRRVRFKDIGGLLKHLVGTGFQGGPQACVVYWLMPVMGLQAIYLNLNLSKRRQEDQVHPYLLKQFSPEGAPMTCGVWISRTFERPEARCI